MPRESPRSRRAGARTRKAAPRPKGESVLARLRPEEAATVLRSLLAGHPELGTEAEEIAEKVVTDVDVEAVAEDVEQAVAGLDPEDIGARAGKKAWGYIEPDEAALELLEEALEPFLDEMKRPIELGLEEAAVRSCEEIVLGLYRCRGRNSDDVLGWAEDFPAETARDAVASLARERAAKHRRVWRPPDAFRKQVPEWADLIKRGAGS